MIDLVKSLHGFNCKVEIYDPWVSVDEASSEYGVDLVPELVLENMTQLS